MAKKKRLFDSETRKELTRLVNELKAAGKSFESVLPFLPEEPQDESDKDSKEEKKD